MGKRFRSTFGPCSPVGPHFGVKSLSWGITGDPGTISTTFRGISFSGLIMAGEEFDLDIRGVIGTFIERNSEYVVKYGYFVAFSQNDLRSGRSRHGHPLDENILITFLLLTVDCRPRPGLPSPVTGTRRGSRRCLRRHATNSASGGRQCHACYRRIRVTYRVGTGIEIDWKRVIPSDRWGDTASLCLRGVTDLRTEL